MRPGEEYNAKADALRNDYGQPVEEFEIQFIDGDGIDCDLAEQFVDDGLCGEIPDCMRYYFDYEAYARDLAMDYSHATINGTRIIYRFWRGGEHGKRERQVNSPKQGCRGHHMARYLPNHHSCNKLFCRN